MLFAGLLWLFGGGLFAPAAGAVGFAMFWIGLDLERIMDAIKPPEKKLSKAEWKAMQAATAAPEPPARTMDD